MCPNTANNDVKSRTSQDREDRGKGVEQLTPALRGGEPGPDAQLHWQQRAADEQQADVDELQRQVEPHHRCRDRTRNTMGSRPVICPIKSQTEPLTLFRVWSQSVKPSTSLLYTSQGKWKNSRVKLNGNNVAALCEVKFTQVFTQTLTQLWWGD